MTPERIELRVGMEDFIVLCRQDGIDSMILQQRLEDALTSIKNMLRPEWDKEWANC